MELFYDCGIFHDCGTAYDCDKKKFDVRKDNRCNNFETRKTVFDSFIIKLPLLISSVLTRLYSLMMKT